MLDSKGLGSKRGDLNRKQVDTRTQGWLQAARKRGCMVYTQSLLTTGAWGRGPPQTPSATRENRKETCKRAKPKGNGPRWVCLLCVHARIQLSKSEFLFLGPLSILVSKSCLFLSSFGKVLPPGCRAAGTAALPGFVCEYTLVRAPGSQGLVLGST